MIYFREDYFLLSFFVMLSFYGKAYSTEDSFHRIENSGLESFNVISAGPNLARCGASPALEIHASGSGIDDSLGAFNVSASFCFNPSSLRVYDLIALDTFVTSGDSYTVIGEPYTQAENLDICLSGNDRPVRYTISGGTGSLSNIRGSGTFDILSNISSCNGQNLPSFVSFCGSYCLH